MLNVFSIFRSIQGESTRSGLPCSFVRLAGCPLRCSYCDTAQARDSQGEVMSTDQILAELARLSTRLVEVTGGEPLAQEETGRLLSRAVDAGYELLLETSGAFPIGRIDPRVRVILDMKCPGSGMADRMHYGNLELLRPDRHEVKFAVSSREDFDWAAELCRKYGLGSRAELLISPVAGRVAPAQAAEWILESDQTFRLQIQLHRILWPEAKGEC